MRDEIAEAMDRLRGYAEASLIFQCLQNGLLDELVDGLDLVEWAGRRNWDAETLMQVCEFLAVAGLAKSITPGRWQLTTSGQNCRAARGFYELFVGGYQQTVVSLGDLLAGGADTNCRDFRWVTQGSANIGRYDSIPLTKRLMAQLPSHPKIITDLGCGNAAYLLTYIERFPHAIVRGCDLSAESLENARNFLVSQGLQQRIELSRHDASTFPLQGDEDTIVLAFVLHEIVGAQGLAVAETFLKRVHSQSPRASLIIIEVDGQPAPAQMQTRSGRGYYNLYNLLQRLTEQKLLPLTQWKDMLQRSGYRIACVEQADQDVDDAELEFGILAIPN